MRVGSWGVQCVVLCRELGRVGEDGVQCLIVSSSLPAKSAESLYETTLTASQGEDSHGPYSGCPMHSNERKAKTLWYGITVYSVVVTLVLSICSLDLFFH